MAESSTSEVAHTSPTNGSLISHTLEFPHDTHHLPPTETMKDMSFNAKQGEFLNPPKHYSRYSRHRKRVPPPSVKVSPIK